jgi:hypothetical protein
LKIAFESNMENGNSSEKRGLKRVRIDEEAIVVHLPESTANNSQIDEKDLIIAKLTNKINELSNIQFDLKEEYRSIEEENLALKVYVNNLEKSVDYKNNLIDKLRFELRFFDIAYQRILYENNQVIARIDKENEEIERNNKLIDATNDAKKQEQVRKIVKQDKCVLM